jgi:hypothetical protein
MGKAPLRDYEMCNQSKVNVLYSDSAGMLLASGRKYVWFALSFVNQLGSDDEWTDCNVPRMETVLLEYCAPQRVIAWGGMATARDVHRLQVHVGRLRTQASDQSKIS